MEERAAQGGPLRKANHLHGAEDPVPRIPQAGDDIAPLVQAVVHRAAVDGHIRVLRLDALDALRGEVYWAAFDLASRARLVPDSAAPVKDLAQFVENCKKPLFFVGDGAALCYNVYGQTEGVLPCPPALGLCRGAGVCLAARAMNDRGEAMSAAALAPSYLRLSQAERERAERGQSLRP